MNAPLLAPIEIERPPAIKFGAGLAAQVGALCPRPWLHPAGRRLRRIQRQSDRAAGLAGQPGGVFGTVRPEPDIPNLNLLLAMVAEAEADMVVGFGGGSAMDLAKLAAVLPGSGQTIHDVAGAEKVRGRRGAALVQVPTTAGTGSEAGTRALVTDPATQNKLTDNVVAPGATDTAMLRDPARAPSAPRMPPIGRFVQPEEVAALAAFLLSPEAGAITGQQIVMCGGASL